MNVGSEQNEGCLKKMRLSEMRSNSRSSREVEIGVCREMFFIYVNIDM